MIESKFCPGKTKTLGSFPKFYDVMIKLLVAT